MAGAGAALFGGDLGQPNRPVNSRLSRDQMTRAVSVANTTEVKVRASPGTGGKANLERSVTETMRRARSVFDVPLALGFGLQTPDQLETLPEDARPDAAVLGSALLRHIGEGKDAGEFLEKWTRG